MAFHGFPAALMAVFNSDAGLEGGQMMEGGQQTYWEISFWLLNSSLLPCL